jgi:hypothetical protein
VLWPSGRHTNDASIALRVERAIDLASDEANVPPDPQTGQAALAGVLEDGLGGDAPEQRAQLDRGEQWLIERKRANGLTHLPHQADKRADRAEKFANSPGRANQV